MFKVFEEVDELKDDEKGFWIRVLELSTSRGCEWAIICTTNTFNSAIRQVHGMVRNGVAEDMYRLLAVARAGCSALRMVLGTSIIKKQPV